MLPTLLPFIEIFRWDIWHTRALHPKKIEQKRPLLGYLTHWSFLFGYYYTHLHITFPLTLIKGTVSRDFLLLVFFLNQFPQASDYTIRAVSNFFENSRRYSQHKVCHRCQQHRWQMEKTFKQKNFNNFVWTPLGSRVNIYKKFCLQVHFKRSVAWYCCHYLPSVSLTNDILEKIKISEPYIILNFTNKSHSNITN